MDFVDTSVPLTRYKELKYVLRFVKVYCATLKMTRYEEGVTVVLYCIYATFISCMQFLSISFRGR